MDVDTGFLNYIINNLSLINKSLIEHINVTSIAILFAITIGVPLGILINRYSKWNRYVIGLLNTIQSLPSLAVLGFLIPFFGIGEYTAIVMVIMYSLLPIVKNTYVGLQNISPKMLEVAKGIGLTRMQILYKIEIPLALPVIMSGIRISLVLAIGLVTLAALVGAGGLGYLVYSGLQTVNYYQILAGAIPACLLALALDWIFSIVEKIVTPITNSQEINKFSLPKYSKKSAISMAVVVSILAIGLFFGLAPKEETKTITIASKNFTEQIILGNIYSMLIKDRTDFIVNEKFNLGGTQVVFLGMQKGDIDVYIEYTGTGLVNILKKKSSTDSQKVYEIVKKEYKEKYGIEWLDPIGFNNTYALAVKKEYAEKLNLKTISDLVKYNNQVRIAPTIEFANRVDGLPGIEKVYGLKFKSVDSMDAALRYVGLEADDADVIDAFSTDGLLKKYKLVVLKDDKSFFPPYYAAPIIRLDTLNKYPELKEILNILSGKITELDMIDLNYEVDVNGRSYEDVAREYLIKQGLIKG